VHVHVPVPVPMRGACELLWSGVVVVIRPSLATFKSHVQDAVRNDYRSFALN
jgi:hypothetical protein